jgi:hypothetical protein
MPQRQSGALVRDDGSMGDARGTKTEGVGPRKGTEGSCPDCGHPNAKHEGSPEDEFVASHGGVGYAFCLEVDPSGETADPCGCRMVMGSSREARELTPAPDRSGEGT